MCDFSNKTNSTVDTAADVYCPTVELNNLTKFTSIQYPGVVSNADAMLKTLGGINKISETICDANRKLQLWFRPEDRFSKPVNGNRRPSNAFVIKVKVKKKTRKVVSYSVLGSVTEEFYFNALCDFQYMAIKDGVNIYKDVIPTTLDGNWFQTEVDFFLMPPMFTRVDSVQSYYYSKDKLTETGQSSKVISSTRRKRMGLGRFFTFEEKDVPTCPRKVISEMIIVTELSEKDVALLKKLFDDRPIYSKAALAAVSGISLKDLKLIVPHVAYHFNNGPWRAMWVRFGYDPRIDPSAAKYQTLDFRLRKGDDDPSVQAKRQHMSAVVPRIAKRPGSSQNAVASDEHIFCPGKLPPYRQFFYQICDVHVEEVQSLFAAAELRPVCDSADGWLPEGLARAFRQIMGSQISEETARRHAEGAESIIYSDMSLSSESEEEF